MQLPPLASQSSDAYKTPEKTKQFSKQREHEKKNSTNLIPFWTEKRINNNETTQQTNKNTYISPKNETRVEWTKKKSVLRR